MPLTAAKPALPKHTIELLMIGASAYTYRLDSLVTKTPRIDLDEPAFTGENAKAMSAEANAYKLLGQHDRIAQCLDIGPCDNMITLQYYPNGNLKDYMRTTANSKHLLIKFAKQMIEGVAYMHSKGIRHSDIRLDQWLVDDEGNARLSDFNSAGLDGNPELEIPATRALGIEEPSYCMPRDFGEDTTERSDLFALGSALYELEYGSAPLAGLDDETIERRFRSGEWPEVGKLRLGDLAVGCWEGTFSSAAEMLEGLVD